MKHIVLLMLIPAYGLSQSAIDILQTSAAKIKTLKNISYNIYDEKPFEKVTADVTIERDAALPILDARIKITGIAINNAGSLPLSFTYNGQNFRYSDLKTKEIVSLDSPSYTKLSRTGMMMYIMLALPPYCQKEPLGSILIQLTKAEKKKDTMIYNVPCYSIDVTMEVKTEVLGNQILESTWFIDKKDYFITGNRSSLGQYFLKVRTTNEIFDDSYFSLSSVTTIKKITGKEPLTDGLLSVGTKAPAWPLPSNHNKEIKLNDLKGKVILLDFWGTWCLPCLKAMPDIQFIYEKFKDQPVEVIGVSVETEKKADPAAYIKKKGYTYTIVLDGHMITKDYKVVQYPSIYIIDKTGTIIHAEHSGNREEFKEDLIKRIETAIKEK